MEQAARENELAAAPFSGRARRWLADVSKRLVDVLLSGLALLFLGPFFLLIAWAIRRDTPGPVFFRGERLGYQGRIFKILKFRTMYERPESYQGPRVTAQDDPRVTPFGRWLRQTKLNELPQFWNVFKGEMSLVGPRPEDPQLAADWPPALRQEVLSVRPGVTSPASVLYRDEEELLAGQSLMETYLEALLPSKLRLDQLYVRNRSPWLDLDVLFWTLLVLLPRLGAGQPPEDALFAGPFSRFLRRPLSWFVVDTLISLLALALSGLIWRLSAPLNVGWVRSFALALIFALLFSICGMLLGVHRVSWTRADYGELFNLAAAASLATLLTLGLNAALGGGQPVLPPALLLSAALLSFGGFVLVRYRGRLLGDLAGRWLGRRGGGARAAQERVLIVGSGEAGQLAAWLLTNGRSAGLFNVVGYVDDDLAKQGLRIRGVNVLGVRQDIPRLVQQHDIGLLVFAIHNIEASARQHLIELCAQTPARLVELPDVFKVLNGVHPVPGAGGSGEAGLPQALLLELDGLAQAGDLATLRRRLAELLQAGQESPGVDSKKGT